MADEYLSLVRLAETGCLPDHQLMDETTLNWIEANNPFGNAFALPHVAIILGAKDFDLTKFSPDVEWFLADRCAGGIHGERHICRVVANCSIAGKYLAINPQDVDAAVTAAIVHDICRLNDKTDDAHGLRAADWLRYNQVLLEERIGRGISARTRDAALTAIILHEKPYKAFTQQDQSLYGANRQVVDLLKTADALDRYRLPKTKWWINDKLLRLYVPDEIKSFSFRLVVESEALYLRGRSAVSCVKTAVSSLIEAI